MLKTLLTIIFPPYAVCRFGCINSCALPVLGLWVGGLSLLAYYFVAGQETANDVIRLGSLLGGLGLIGISVVWAQTAINRFRQGDCSGGKRGVLCQTIPPATQSSEEKDPLEEVERARNL